MVLFYFSTLIFLCVYTYACMHVHMCVCMQRLHVWSEDNLKESVLSFHHVGSGALPQAASVFALSLFAGPVNDFKETHPILLSDSNMVLLQCSTKDKSKS